MTKRLRLLGVALVFIFLFAFIYNVLYISRTPSAVHFNHTENFTENALPNSTDNYGRPLTLDHEHEDGKLTSLLKKNVRIFCWILTNSANTWKRAIHVNATWAPRCNKYVFVTPDEASGLPSLKVDVSDARKNLWGKTKRAFEYIYKTELNNFDWFLKADDDTYVIVDNLRFMLLAHSPTEPVYFGCRFKTYVTQGYMSGGAGYVLSREALRRFAEISLPNPSYCTPNDSGAEDIRIGKCLENVGVRAGDSRDGQAKHRMLPFPPMYHLDSKKVLPTWFPQYIYYPYEQGPSCCSDHMISFHYMTHESLYTIHNLLYHIHAFGVVSANERTLLTAGASLSDEKLLEMVRGMASAEMPTGRRGTTASSRGNTTRTSGLTAARRNTDGRRTRSGRV